MGCNRCSSTPCSCGPQPYYTQIEMCPEDNCQKIYVNQFTFAVCPTDSWNIPSCGASAWLTVDGVQNVSIGSFIWGATYGYFEVIGINTGQIQISNPCFESNAAPGTQVPACYCFVVTADPTVSIAQQDGVFVAYDFVAPGNGDCLDIILTGAITGGAGDNIQIGAGIYLISEIKPNNVITICNEGDGITPGTPVIALDASGRYQYPVTVLSQNPCNEDPIELGTVIVCEDLVQHKLTGGTIGHVLTLTNTTTGEAEYADSGVTALTVRVDTLEDEVAGLSSGVIENTAANNTGTISGSGTLTINTNNASVVINNPSTINTEKVHFTVDAYIVGEASNGLTEAGTFTLSLNVDTGGGPITVRVVGRPFSSGTDTVFDYADQITYSGVLTIAASGSATITASGTILTGATAPGVGPDLIISTFRAKISAIGVAV